MIKKLTSQILAFTDTRYIEAQKNIIKKLIHEAESQGYHEARNKFSVTTIKINTWVINYCNNDLTVLLLQ